jgi:hypothetical protein
MKQVLWHSFNDFLSAILFDVLWSRPSAKRQTVRSSTRASVQLVR